MDLIEVAERIGIPFAVILIGAVIMFRMLQAYLEDQKRKADESKRDAEHQTALLHFVEQQAVQFAQYRTTFEQVANRQAELIAATIKAVEANSGAVSEHTARIATLQLEFAKNLADTFRKAQDDRKQIVTQVGERIDASQLVTGGAIEGVQTTVTAQHAEGTEQLQMAVDNLNKKIEENGEATRDWMEQQVKPILNDLTDIRASLETLKTQSNEQAVDAQAQQKAIADMSEQVDRVLSTLTKFTGAYEAREAASHIAPAPVVAIPEPPPVPVPPDPLTQPQKHSTGNLPPLPETSPDKRASEKPEPKP